MNKKIIIAVAGIVIAGVAFYAGSAYGKGAGRGIGAGNFNAQFAGGAAARTGARTAGAAAGGGFTSGNIISQDKTGVTIKMQDGSTKIILVGPSAQVTKSAEGSLNDLTVGTSVSITGTANSDGSITAQSVQLRPAGFGAVGTSTPR